MIEITIKMEGKGANFQDAKGQQNKSDIVKQALLYLGYNENQIKKLENE